MMKAADTQESWGGEAGFDQIKPSPRVRMLRERNIGLKPRVGYEAALYWTQAYRESEGEPTITRRAKALRKFAENVSLCIHPGELIVGGVDKRPLSSTHYPDVTCDWVEEELDLFPTRKHDAMECDEETKKIYREDIIPYWRGKTLNEIWHQRAASVAPEAYRVGVGTGISDQGIIACMTVNHIIPDYTRVLKKGFLGIREDVAGKLEKLNQTDAGYFGTANFYNALLIVCDAVAKFGKRYADHARDLAKNETDPHLKADYLRVADVCDRVPAEPARNFHEALQALYFAYCVSLNEACGNGFGRLDQYLYPWLKKDLEEGVLTREEAQELLDCFFIKCSERQLFFSSGQAKYSAGARGTHNICVGGIDENGFDATNDLSYMLLQAMCNVRIGQPSVQVLWHANMPEELAIKACQLISLGTGHPAIYSMERLVDTLQELGLPLKEARRGTIVGCVEPSAEPGKADTHADAGQINLATAFEFALNQGVWRLNNERMGYPTADPRTFTSFDQVMEAFRKQIEFIVGHHVTLGQIARNLHEEMDPDPYADLLFEECIERGKDIHSGGARYAFGPGIFFTGVADVINSMAAVKYLIFDRKTVQWDELLDALNNNFEGTRGEEICQMCLHAPKYGNGDPYVDGIGRELMRIPGEETAKYTSQRGGRWRAAIVPLTAIFPLGMVTGALPSGRKAGLPLAEGCSPKQGTDTLGPTAVIKSVTSLDHSGFLDGTQLNLKFSPTALKDRRGLMNLAALIKTYIARGGWHVQMNVVSKETLIAAKKNPEEYRGLTVRVSGYNAYFSALTEEMQDDIIARTEHALMM